jgi:uncharacterized protein with ParB-like and HNH nuclease domain
MQHNHYLSLIKILVLNIECCHDTFLACHAIGSYWMNFSGLSDIQRPFVWKTSKVRDLFDSMYKGFPVGYLLFWSNAVAGTHRAIGADKKQKNIPRLLIVDGQQRMTSLYAVLKNVPVKHHDYTDQKISCI